MEFCINLELRFDFSGNGESEGKFEDQCYSKYVEELKNSIDFMKKDNKKIIVIGHSFGSNIIVLEYEKYNNINKIITLAPGFFLERKRVLNLVLGFIISSIKGKENFIDSWGEKRSLKIRFFLERIKYNIKNAIKKINVPLLIILAGDDRAINNKKSKRFFKNNGINYTEIINARHGFGKEKYLNHITKEILKWLK
ncbi:alpha/beta hydrolase [Candidatus Woesearchaeota archaeon]|nr:alpha/beta hydrolase [Candidatus Woesearchaeota archaeon]